MFAIWRMTANHPTPFPIFIWGRWEVKRKISEKSAKNQGPQKRPHGKASEEGLDKNIRAE